ncbi:MAG TPA: hypothetical protein ACFYEM_05425 [Candidatus Hypogeohydataceae bacterium YC40]
MKKGLLVLFYMLLCSTYALATTQCELEWQTPKNVTYQGLDYVVWFYEITNNTEQPITVPLEVFLATDTGGKYMDRYHPGVEKILVGEEGGYRHALTIAGQFGPHEKKKAIAYFEDVDKNAKELYIYVTGLSHFFFWRWRMVDYSYRIVYKKSESGSGGWNLVEHGFNKDATHKDYPFRTDSPPSGPSSRYVQGLMPENTLIYKAPSPALGGQRRKDIEDFISVWDAIFSADKMRTAKKAIELWEAVTDRAEYKELNMEFPEKVCTWEEARERNKNLLEKNHALVLGEPFLDPHEALWHTSKLDGYQELKDGILLIYTRYVRYYKKEYHYGLAILKVKNTLPYTRIPRWNQYPYVSRWKIVDYRWKHITKPNWNQEVFAGYPKVTW